MPRLDLVFERYGALEQVADFTFTDDATPLGIDDTTGSTGAISISLAPQDVRPAHAKQLRGQAVTMSTVEGEAPRAIGTVTGATGTEATIGVDVDMVSLRLAVRRNAKPFTGTLAAALVYWAGLCSVPASSVVVDAAIATQQVLLVGFSDNVWLRIKQLCAATGIEVVVRDNQIVVRRPRAVFVDAERVSTRAWAVDDTTLAQKITVAFYEPQNVVAGDSVADYTRSNVPDDTADDPDGGLADANNSANVLPQGYKKARTLGDDGGLPSPPPTSGGGGPTEGG